MSRRVAFALVAVTVVGLLPLSPSRLPAALAAEADAPIVGTWKVSSGGKGFSVLRVTKVVGGKVEGTYGVGHFGGGPARPPFALRDSTYADGVFEWAYDMGPGDGLRFTGKLGADGGLAGTYVNEPKLRRPAFKWSAKRDPDAK